MKRFDLLERAAWHLDESKRCREIGAVALARWHCDRAHDLERAAR